MTRPGKKPGSALATLNAAALALPAIAQGAAPPAELELGIATSTYREGNVASSDVLLGSTHRYDIDIHQFYITIPVASAWSVGVDAARETMTGASPWGTVRGVDGSPKLIMTGATIEESRNQYALDITRYFERGLASVTVIHSTEDDYESTGLVLGGEAEFDGGARVFGVAASYAEDDLEPTDARAFGRIQQAKKRSHSLSTTYTQIIDRNTVLQLGVSATRDSGYLSDPYKLRDVRPDERHEWTATARFRRYVTSANAAWHVNYRFYRDDFGVAAHTLDTAWYQNVGPRVQLVPYVRYHAQREADFFTFVDNYAVPVEVDQSSDHRLASFGALSGGVKAIWQGTRWSASLGAERYISKEGLGFDDVAFDHPAALDYSRVTLSWDIRL